MFHFNHLISEPTRICASSSTTIDLILVSDSDKFSQSGVKYLFFCDHSMIYCTRKLIFFFIASHKNVTLRSLKRYNKDDFQASFLSTDWNSVIMCDDTAWNNFRNLFLHVIDSTAPVLKQRTVPWIDSYILQAISDRDKAFKLYKRDRSIEHFNSFKTLSTLSSTQCKNKLFF